ncbi:MAG: ATPase domain-containing protein [Methanofollis sp.]|uniref:RAD55 family ATPase n=1 Tax=Methanofollis sp. TaxID=2052835 RepID=UPI0026241674|nr:ATPase domain-containing protein [Methanofollis sp.]MDD4254799.1 ATPase domain-containing protein [Methanofollis sp.]
MDREKQRSTGLVGLDLVLEGGIPKGTVIIVAGTPTNGLELFARQFWKGDPDNPEEGTYLMLDGKIEEGMTDAREIPPDQYPAHLHGQRIVIDSLSSIILRHGIDDAIDLVTRGLREKVAEGANVALIMYLGIHRKADEIKLIRLVDGYLELKQGIEGSEVERMLGVFKMIGTELPKQLIPYNITAEGLELSTTKRVV